ncbi:MAG TPA: PQQ-binding-like beta-propeller repeat protein [Gemmatimonadales bacterium]|nr:PQQ-binding-like beta-propeller repeat protein [Gemmatimonadales bacterium]
MQRPAQLAALLLGAALVAGSDSRASIGADEPAAVFRGDLAHTGSYASPPLTRFGGVQWRVQTGGPVQSSPAVVDGVVYVGSGDGNLYALDARTGTQRWKFAAGRAVTASPAVSGGLVFIGSRDGAYFAVEAATGRQRWRIETGPDAPLAWGFESGDLYTSSPAVAQGLAVLGGSDGQVYAVDAATGAVRWRFRTGGRVRSSPAVSGGRVYVGSMDGTLYALELASGRPVWRFDTEGHTLESGKFGFDRRTIQSSPAVAEGRVFVGSRDGHLYAVDAATGRLVWRADHEMSWVNSSPAVVGGLVFAGSSDNRFVQAVDARTGKERWRVATERLVWSSPAVTGELVYVGDASGTLYALDCETGAERWRHRTGRRIYSSPVPSGGLLYVGNDDGAVYALRGDTLNLRRGVFWDSTFAKANRIASHAEIRGYLAERGYEVLDASGLARFLRHAMAAHARSVVVFAMDHLPSTVAPVAADSVLFRRYLEAGGKIVWLGTPPMVWPKDVRTGDVEYIGVDRAAGGRLLGVDHRTSNFDTYGARATAAGQRWGLTGWWDANWPVDTAAVTETLGLDERGLAAAWVRRYGGPPGTGFVRINGAGANGGPMPNFAEIQTVAEYLPSTAGEGR